MLVKPRFDLLLAIMPYCKHCKRDKLESDFYSYAKSKCRSCTAYHARLLREQTTIEARREQRLRQPCRLKAKKPYSPPTGLKRLKQLARWRACRAVERGQAPPRPDRCPKCNRLARVQIHHHNGYENPLDFVYLCSGCHADIHAEKPANATYIQGGRGPRVGVVTEAFTLPNCRKSKNSHL